MSKGLSLHIGLNSIDPAHYGTTGALRGCENDARQMERIATGAGFRATVVLTKDATSTRFLSEIRQAAKTLESGDIFLLTYAGHGSQIPDTGGDEDDGRDETLCLYDRMFIDDELRTLWTEFAPGVRVCFVVDACHSATMTRAIDLRTTTSKRNSRATIRALPAENAQYAFETNIELYTTLKAQAQSTRDLIACSVLSLSACLDSQTAADGPSDGAFTTALIATWNRSQYRGHYVSFIKDIGARVSLQIPVLDRAGTPQPAFEQQVPFTIAAPTTNGARPMRNSTIVEPTTRPNSEFLSIDDRLARLRAATTSRGLNGASSDIVDDDQHIDFTLKVPRTAVIGRSDEEVFTFLRDNGTDTLMRAFLSATSIPFPRDFEAHAECHVDTHGNGGCSGGVSIRF